MKKGGRFFVYRPPYGLIPISLAGLLRVFLLLNHLPPLLELADVEHPILGEVRGREGKLGPEGDAFRLAAGCDGVVFGLNEDVEAVLLGGEVAVIGSVHRATNLLNFNKK